MKIIKHKKSYFKSVRSYPYAKELLAKRQTFERKECDGQVSAGNELTSSSHIYRRVPTDT